MIEKWVLDYPEIYDIVLRHEMMHAEITQSDKSLLRKTWENLALEYRDIPEKTKLFLVPKKETPINYGYYAMCAVVGILRLPGDLLLLFLVFGLRVTRWLTRG